MVQVSEPGEVTAANRRFYDQIASVYDDVDSRRGDKVDHAWIDGVLASARTLLATSGRDPASFEFLDAGAGSGFLAQRARNHFRRITLLDISKPMLGRIDLPGARKVQGDCGAIPLREAAVDFVGAFATLHHLYAPEHLFREAYRVLRPGGIFYCDHDIERGFVERFRIPLKIYRALFDHGHAYLEHCPEATQEDYETSEFHGDEGLAADAMTRSLQQVGFRIVETKVHWDGMGVAGGLIRRLGLQRIFDRPRWAPVTRILAVKP